MHHLAHPLKKLKTGKSMVLQSAGVTNPLHFSSWLLYGFLLVSSLDLLMDAKPIVAGLGALRACHSIDRALYAILVTELWRDPVESIQIIALWLWLEQVGFGKVTRKILASAPLFINQTAEEAIMCLKCIKDSRFIYSTEATDIPMTRSIIEKEISFRFFNENRVIALRGVSKIINQDCLHRLQDIIAKALDGNAGKSSSRDQMKSPFNASPRSLSNPNVMSFCGRQRSESNQMMMPCQFNESLIHNFSSTRVGRNAFQGNNQVRNEVPSEDRTMFVTFSKGYPVSEMEVRNFFTSVFGYCIESFRMQKVRPNEQPLYARVVFLKASFVVEILDGREKAKFIINGKHVWMRKFVPRNDDYS